MARILQKPAETRQTYPDSVTPSLDENYKYVDISTFQKTHNLELGGEILVFLCWLRVGNYSLCLHQRPICGLQAADGEGGLCYYNFTKLLQLLEAVLRLFVRAQGSAGLTFREGKGCYKILAQHFVIITKKRFKARKIGCFENSENRKIAMKIGFKTVHLDRQTLFGPFWL